MDLKERIKLARKTASLSQSQFANLLGVSFMTVRRWEAGEVSPRINEIQQISKLLNTPVEYFIGVSDALNTMPPKINNEVIAEHITTGISEDKITVHDDNSNLTFSFPNNEEGRKTLFMLINRHQNKSSPIFANSISGDNNNGNNLGVIHDTE